MSDSSVRSEAMAGVMRVAMALQDRHGTQANVDIMQGIAIALTAFASKQGGQSVDCPVGRIEEEATAILTSLSDAFK